MIRNLKIFLTGSNSKNLEHFIFVSTVVALIYPFGKYEHFSEVQKKKFFFKLLDLFMHILPFKNDLISFQIHYFMHIWHPDLFENDL